ncbi:MAG: integrase/recombinase XerD [Solirubrobacteraceae bacterium]|nr:integrase/recombinase XerD [Solirubrobacteraceae bacterium]
MAAPASSLPLPRRRSWACLTRGDALNARDARDWAVRDYRRDLQTVLKRKPATVHNALAAVDDLYIRCGLGPANAARAELPRTAPKALSTKPRCGSYAKSRSARRHAIARSRSSRSTPAPGSPRSPASTSTTCACPHARASCGSSARGEKIREIPIHPQLRTALNDWIGERRLARRRHPRPVSQPTRRPPLGQGRARHHHQDRRSRRPTGRRITAHVLRHTFATRLVRGHTDLVIVAELLGHARLETTRAYSRPTQQDAIDALHLLDVDH